MLKQSLATLFLCLCFAAGSCTDRSSGFFAGGGEGAPPPGSGDKGGGGSQGGGSSLGGSSLAKPGGSAEVSDASTNPNAGRTDEVGPTGDPSGPPEPVPEPMTMLLFGSGLAGVAYRYRRRKSVAAGETSAA